MNPDELSALLRAARASAPVRGPTCPDEHATAAYVDGSLDNEPREQFEGHLADCAACLTVVGLLSRERDPAKNDSTAAVATSRSRKPVPAGRRAWDFSVPQWAAAAVVIMAMAGVVRLVPSLPQVGDVESQTRAPTTRSSRATTVSPVLLSPRPGATVVRDQLTVRWTALPGTRYYDVRVVTDGGDVVAEEHVTANEWRPGEDVDLRHGVEYFVHVDAYVSGGKAIGSEHVSFYVSNDAR